MSMRYYAVLIEELDETQGGGFIAYVPDLPGCKSDGKTRQEALANVDDAIHCWIAAAREMGREIPEPRRHHEEFA